MDELFAQVLLPRALHIQTYEAYARARVADLVYEAQLEGAYIAEAFLLESSYLENQGDHMVLRPLPLAAQTAPIFGMLVEDVDGDGALDVLAIGNDYASDVLTGRYDAFTGLWLRGDGRGHFQPVAHVRSGFFCRWRWQGSGTAAGGRTGCLSGRGKSGTPSPVSVPYQRSAPLSSLANRSYLCPDLQSRRTYLASGTLYWKRLSIAIQFNALRFPHGYPRGSVLCAFGTRGGTLDTRG